MAAKTYYLSNNILDDIFRGGALPPTPGPVYVALNTTASTPSTPGTEDADANYARQAVTFTVSGPTYTRNTNLLNFYGAGRAAGSATIVEIAIYDSGGNELYYAPVGSPPTVNAGDTAKIDISNITVTEAGAASNYLNQAILGAVLSNVSYGPVTLYVALNTTTSTGSTPGTEVVDANYARVAAGSWGGAGSGMISNNGALNFFGAGAAGGPYTIVEAAIYDAPTGGNELYFGTLTTPRTVNSSDTLAIEPSNFTVTES